MKWKLWVVNVIFHFSSSSFARHSLAKRQRNGNWQRSITNTETVQTNQKYYIMFALLHNSSCVAFILQIKMTTEKKLYLEWKSWWELFSLCMTGVFIDAKKLYAPHWRGSQTHWKFPLTCADNSIANGKVRGQKDGQ